MTAPTDGRRQTKGRHHILINFYRQSLVKGNTYTSGLLRTTGQLLSKQFMQEVTKLSPLMLCSTLYMVKSAKLINKSLSMFSVRSKTVLSNPRQKVPTPLKWIDIFQLHYCFLAFTHLKLQYLCIHDIFWTDLICFKQLSDVLLDLCQISCSGCYVACESIIHYEDRSGTLLCRYFWVTKKLVQSDAYKKIPTEVNVLVTCPGSAWTCL